MKCHLPSLHTLQQQATTLILSLLLSLTLFPAQTHAQSANAAPRREQLLNGLRVLLLHRPNDPQVLLKLRVNNGAAFDLAGKEGMMQTLSDGLFPDPGTRSYVSEELGGRLEVMTTYDHIEIALSGRANEFERLADLLRNALLQMRLAPEEVTRLRDERIKSVKETGASPAALADRAIAQRLYGSYPYGRTIAGTPDSLARLDRADLLFARDRFLNPSNSMLVVIGGVEAPRALRAIRQLLGSWRKDVAPPATFRQPEAPDARTLIVNAPGTETAEIRLAVRSVSRADRDLAATSLLAVLLRERWTTSLKEFQPASTFVRHEPHALNGTLLFGANVPAKSAAQSLEAARVILRNLAAAPLPAAALDQARRAAFAELNERRQAPSATADEWLDAASYNSTLAQEEAAMNALTPADIQRVAARLFSEMKGETKLASVAVGDAEQLRNVFAQQKSVTQDSGAKLVSPAATPARRP